MLTPSENRSLSGAAGAARQFRALLAPFGIVTVLLFQQSASAQLEGDTNLLRDAAQQYDDNRNALRTWQGRVEISDTIVDTEGAVTRRTTEVDFVVEPLKDSLIWHWNPRTANRTKDEIQEELPLEQPRAGLLKDDVFHKYGSMSTVRDTAADHVRMHAREDLSIGPVSGDFYPMYYFTDGGASIGEMLRFYSLAAGNMKMAPTTVRQDGSLLIIAARQGEVYNEHRIDLNQSANLVHFAGIDPYVREEREISYIQDQGIWVPNHFHYYNERKDVGKVVEREIRWLENKVNRQLAADAFSLSALGAQPGNVVSDARSGVEFRLPQPDVATANAAQPARWNRWILVAANLVAIVAVAAYFILRRVRRPEKQ